LQNSTNLNFSKHFPKAASGLNLGFGAEYRYERYKIFAGEKASYANYDVNGVKAAGSQGFPGYQPADEVNVNRSVFGGFVDPELDVTKKWLIDFANLYEHYSDYGSSFTTKFATVIKWPRTLVFADHLAQGSGAITTADKLQQYIHQRAGFRNI
jgi:iron complex outermembrane receptor protein